MTDNSYTIIRNAFSRAVPAEQTRVETERCYSKQVRDEIMEICVTRKYTPVVAYYLMQLNIDTDFWSQQYAFFKTRNENILAFVTKLFDVFEAQKITSPFVYENFGALLESGTDIALYASGDVDICASYSEFNAICRVMNDYGFILTEEKTKFLKCFRVGFVGKIGELDYRINVMFTPIVRYKLPICIDCEKVLAPANFQHYKNTRIRIPTCEMLLYLNMLRISVHGYVRSPDIRLYIDVFNATIHQPDWDLILQWAKADATENRIGTVGYIANKMFHTEIPESILRLANDKRYKVSKILAIVFDSQKNRLNSSLSNKQHLKMEFFSDGKNIFSGLLGLIFPSRKWLREYYCDEKDSLMIGYLKYFKYIF